MLSGVAPEFVVILAPPVLVGVEVLLPVTSLVTVSDEFGFWGSFGRELGSTSWSTSVGLLVLFSSVFIVEVGVRVGVVEKVGYVFFFFFDEVCWGFCFRFSCYSRQEGAK
jgi:hypothetical protein